MAVAYTYASGEICIGAEVPDGALPLGEGTPTEMNNALAGTARKSRTGGLWLVPGIPEADDQGAAMDALLAWEPHFEDVLEDEKAKGEPERCRVCGCTDDCACPGGCHWVEPGLCSACA